MKDNVKRLHGLCACGCDAGVSVSDTGRLRSHCRARGRSSPVETSNSYEPWKHGYRLVDVLNWSPETDNYGEELRARVPLQERNEPSPPPRPTRT